MKAIRDEIIETTTVGTRKKVAEDFPNIKEAKAWAQSTGLH